MELAFVTANIPEAVQGIDAWRFRQVPFATALALTRLAGESQDAMRAHLDRAFTIRRRWVPQGIRIRRATKRHLEAAVFTVDEFMVLHETGGVKRSRGRDQVLPRGVRRSARQVVPRSRWPGALLKRPRSFVAPIRGGARGVFRRKGRGGPAELLWRLHPGGVRIRPRLEFEQTVTRIVNDRFQAVFGRAFAEAISGAR